MKKVVCAWGALILLALLSGPAFGSMDGVWSTSGNETLTLKAKKFRTLTVRYQTEDTMVFHSDGGVESVLYPGSWTQKKAGYTMYPDLVTLAADIEGLLRANGVEGRVTITKVLFRGTEKKNYMMSGSYQISAAVSMDDPEIGEVTGKLTLKGKYSGISLCKTPEGEGVSGCWVVYNSVSGQPRSGPDYFEIVQNGDTVTGYLVSGSGPSKGTAYPLTGSEIDTSVNFSWVADGCLVELTGAYADTFMFGLWEDCDETVGTWEADRIM